MARDQSPICGNQWSPPQSFRKKGCRATEGCFPVIGAHQCGKLMDNAGWPPQVKHFRQEQIEASVKAWLCTLIGKDGDCLPLPFTSVIRHKWQIAYLSVRNARVKQLSVALQLFCWMTGEALLVATNRTSVPWLWISWSVRIISSDYCQYCSSLAQWSSLCNHCKVIDRMNCVIAMQNYCI